MLAQTRQADRDKLHAERLENSHRRMERAAKLETDKLLDLLQAHTNLTQQDKDLTQQDKDLTQQIAELTTQIHALLTKQQADQ